MRLAVLASGAGTNLQAILDRLHGRGLVEVVGVASDKPGAGALDRAAAADVETAVFELGEHPDREARDVAVAAWLEGLGVELVVLAGYMQLLSDAFIRRFRHRVINVHPALLPSFPGLDAIGQAIAHGVRVTGVTVHFVDEGVDTGPILLQRALELKYTRPVAEVVDEIHRIEHELLPQAIELIASGAVSFDPDNPRLVRIGDGRLSTVEHEAAEGAGGAGAPQVRVRRALISVSDKGGVVEFARGLAKLGVEIVSTGGTAATLSEAGVPVRSVEDLTGAPEILDGRVKTLHPKIYAGLLAVRDNPEHQATIESEGIEPIDLVCTNLYPFERTVARHDVSDSEAIENIDIGGPTMIRAAAKNHRDVAVLVRPESYDAVLAELEENGGEISGGTRHWLANEAFAYTARYDAAISRWFSARYEDFPTHLTVSMEKFLDLSYGENPHQKAALYTEVGARSHVLSRIAKQHGRALSFNNVLDLDSARRLLADLDGPACVIVKHNNPCGAAEGETALEAYEKALACDPISAFGGVIAVNRPIDRALAELLHANFVEVLIAPAYDDDAMEVLQRKEAIRILEDSEQRETSPGLDVKRVRGGALVQEADRGRDERASTEVVTAADPTEAQWNDLIFAWKVCRHVRSNAIVLAKDRATVGIGAGQMSRVDSVRIAVDKARDARQEEADSVLAGSVVASDAFFPFADGPQAAIDAGATAIIQPGGSKRDGEVVAACDAAGVAMAFTRRRHFRH